MESLQCCVGIVSPGGDCPGARVWCGLDVTCEWAGVCLCVCVCVGGGGGGRHFTYWGLARPIVGRLHVQVATCSVPMLPVLCKQSYMGIGFVMDCAPGESWLHHIHCWEPLQVRLMVCTVALPRHDYSLRRHHTSTAHWQRIVVLLGRPLKVGRYAGPAMEAVRDWLRAVRRGTATTGGLMLPSGHT